ncbi:hypothetical protein ACFOY4_22545 [Actinomadura syzygii]|uniref:hypothetical protein n=1 Tax=Actinomadura syzygii TaxID=1427538 RepID=UPI001CA32AE2|nr:hypothetical protein [Actinomadura syzygii]
MALSGGYLIDPRITGPTGSRPSGTDGWEVTPPGNYGFPFDFTVYVVCANADTAA